MSAEVSQLYRLIEAGLGAQTLAEYVEANYPAKSWRAMSDDLFRRTGVRASHQTLRLWFADRITVETTVKVA
jgi:hypothetical protein